MTIRMLLRGEAMKKKEILYLLCIITGSLFICLYFNHFFYGDMSVPFRYQDGDNILTALSVKRLINGEYFTTIRMGTPYQSDFVFFPTYADMVSILFIKLLGIFTQNWGWIVNVYYILTYVITAGISYYVMRQFSVQPVIAVGGSLCFTALPYHFLRNTMHLFLSFYAAIPVYILIAYWLCTDEEFWIIGKRFFRNKRNRLVLCLLPFIALSGIYYSFFGCFLLLVAGWIRMGTSKKRWVPVLQTGSIILIICSWILLASVPYRICAGQINEEPQLPVRGYTSAEYLGLKITQLFLPNSSHDIGFLFQIMDRYNDAPLPNESSEYLGIYGILGFLALLLILLGIRFREQRKMEILARLNVSAVLLATIGGFGSIFSVLISPQIRAYNRISVFIAFISMLGISILLTEWCEKWKHRGLPLLLISLLIMGISIYEQSISVTDYYDDTYIAEFYSDQAFIRQIEAEAGDGAKIFQYPYLPFPESPNINQMGDYALARGYLYSDTLLWSYGAYRGTSGDLWERELAACPLEEQVERIRQEGFTGIYIDQYAYTEEELRELCSVVEEAAIAEDTIISDNGRLLFYKLK